MIAMTPQNTVRVDASNVKGPNGDQFFVQQDPVLFPLEDGVVVLRVILRCKQTPPFIYWELFHVISTSLKRSELSVANESCDVLGRMINDRRWNDARIMKMGVRGKVGVAKQKRNG